MILITNNSQKKEHPVIVGSSIKNDYYSDSASILNSRWISITFNLHHFTDMASRIASRTGVAGFFI